MRSADFAAPHFAAPHFAAPHFAAPHFAALHHAAHPLLLPNAWDFVSGAVLADAGFAAIGTTSLGVAAAHGLPDAQGAAKAETVALARRLVRLPCPITVDVEAGFSDDPAEVAELAAELAGLGAVGLNIEDGRGDSVLADPGHQVQLIAGIKRAAPGLYLNARIDTYWLGIGDALLSTTLARAEQYLAAGADGIFVPGFMEAAVIRALVTGIEAPLNVLFAPGQHGVAELADLGVRRISTGSLLFRGALGSIVATAEAIRDGRPVPTSLPSYADVQRLVTEPGGRHAG